jgi:hypothetical protein
MFVTLHNIQTPYTLKITSASVDTSGNYTNYTETINSSQQTTSNLVYLTNQTSSTYAFYGAYDNYYPDGRSAQEHLPADVHMTATVIAPNGTYTTSINGTQFVPGSVAGDNYAYGNKSINQSISTPQLVLSGGSPDTYFYQLTVEYAGLYITAYVVTTTDSRSGQSTNTTTQDTIQNISFYSNGEFNNSTAATDWSNNTGGTLVYSSTSDTTLTQSGADHATNPRSGLYYYASLTYQRSISGPQFDPNSGQTVNTTTYNTATLKSNLVIFA